MKLYSARSTFAWLVCLVLCCVRRSSAAITTGPILLDWSNKTYGPDGPWHALSVSIGSPPQFVDLLLGHIRSTFPLANQNCGPQETCPSRKGGYYDISKSTSVQHLAPFVAQAVDAKAFMPGKGFFHSISTNGTVVAVSDLLTLYSNSEPIDTPLAGVEPITAASSTTTSTGNSYPVTLGWLTNGAPFAGAHSFNESGQVYPRNNHLAYLYTTRRIPSPSFTVHVGSPALGIPPSYVVGGYDRSRVLGRVVSQALPQDLFFTINLQDLGLQTFSGPSPFPSGDQTGLLTNLVGPSTSVPFSLSLSTPYMFLPRLTCTMLTAHLPVHFSIQYGIYLWNFSDPLYEKIMSSNSYLYMKVQANNVRDLLAVPVTIKIPMQLLNMTLEDPISPTPIPYFPCAPVDDADDMALGRAFLQAVTVGMNWNTSTDGEATPGYWFLAQAPGPAPAAPDLFPIATNDESIFGGFHNWESSWEAYWEQVAHPHAVIPPSSSGSTSSGSHTSSGSQTSSGSRTSTTGSGGSTTPASPANPSSPSNSGLTAASGPQSVSNSSGGLSTGAIAGIGVAAAVVVIVLAVFIGLCFFRRRRRRQMQDTQSSSSVATFPKDVYSPEFSRTEVQETSQNVAQDTSQSTSQGATPTVHELPVPSNPGYTWSSPFGCTQYISSHADSSHSSPTQYAVAPPPDLDDIVSPISPAPWSSTTLGEPMTHPEHPPPSYPELAADRGAELEAPRQVEKSGFLVG